MSMADYPFVDKATLEAAAKLKSTINEIMDDRRRGTSDMERKPLKEPVYLTQSELRLIGQALLWGATFSPRLEGKLLTLHATIMDSAHKLSVEEGILKCAK